MTRKGIIIVTQHVKNEWARMAQDAYATGRNFYGHRYSAKAALPEGTMLDVGVFDTLQRTYRQWLIGGWKEIDA